MIEEETPNIQGEGNREADRRYRTKASSFAQSDRVEAAAKDARGSDFKMRSPLSGSSRDVVAGLLHETLAELIDLALQTKQAHWNVVGPHSRALHLQLDEMVASYRKFSDAVAERQVAIGSPAVGVAAAVAVQSRLTTLPDGWLPDDEVVALFVDRLMTTAARLRERMPQVADHDPVTEDLLIEITNEIEEQAWMLQAQLARKQS